jgi:mannose-6-phosphate isomerase-like protein (cupin superfamily)
MNRRVLPVAAVALLLLAAQPLAAQLTAGRPLAERIARSDPAQYSPRTAVHAGAGTMAYVGLFDTSSFETTLHFLHRGVIHPRSGIGHHFHNASEEMFVIFNGEAEFTINGRTSRLRGPIGVPNVLGNSHAIYNPTDEPIEWMNISVSVVKGAAGAFDLDDPRVGVPLDPIPVFMTMPLDRERLRPTESMHGGTGTVMYRRALQSSVFRTAWAYVDHLLLPARTSVGDHRDAGLSKFYYVMSGEGRVRVGSETASIGPGDAVPIGLDEPHALENTGSEPLELMIVAVEKKSEE